MLPLILLLQLLIHALRGDYGLQTDNPGGGINKIEEAYAIQVENKIRTELGVPIRTDGDISEGGNGSYGNFGVETPSNNWYDNIGLYAGSAAGVGSVYKFDDMLSYDPNNYNPSVVDLQTELGITADGYFGDETLQAVEAFQSSHGLTVDGIVGPQTWAALNSGTQGTSNPDNSTYPDLYVNDKYDRDAAVDYATNPAYSSPDKNGGSFLDWEKHTRNYNHDYERYDSIDYYLKGHSSGSDCANFVSQALFAGGVKQTDGFYFCIMIKRGYTIL